MKEGFLISMGRQDLIEWEIEKLRGLLKNGHRNKSIKADIRYWKNKSKNN